MASQPGATIGRYIKSAYEHLEPQQLLAEAPIALLGVSETAEELLSELNIRSIFDLAASQLFATATHLSGGSGDGIAARFGRPAADMVDAGYESRDIGQLGSEDIKILAGLGDERAASLKDALHLSTVRDLALWPPYVAAKAIVSSVLTPEATEGYDSEAPDDLVPTSREYPTERVFYRSLVLDEELPPVETPRRRGPRVIERAPSRGEEAAEGTIYARFLEDEDPDGPVPIANAGQLDPLAASVRSQGYSQPAIGALLSFSQSWYAHGVALGQLLHSVALAPGESTRIAMIDWSRQVRAAQESTDTQTEALTNVTGHSRAISEVTSAVAHESQTGWSQSTADSSTQSLGVGGATLITGPTLIGGSYGTSSTTASGYGYATSSGNREIAAQMAQNISDSTHQAANSARNRRASVVKEVSEQESERVSTRVVANYNHMHALSVQYYEVVQLYRVLSELERVDRCLFLPLKLIDFNDPVVIGRFRLALAAAALDHQIRRTLLADPDALALELPPVPDEGARFRDLDSLGTQLRIQAGPTSSGAAVLPIDVQFTGMDQFAEPSLVLVNGFEVERHDGTTWSYWHSWGGSGVHGTWPRGQADAANPVPLAECRSLRISARRNPSVIENDALEDGSPIPKSVDAHLVLRISVAGQQHALPVTLRVPTETWATTVFEFRVEGGVHAQAALLPHLQANQLHYSQAVWRGLDVATVAAMLRGYQLNGVPLTRLLDSTPVATAGNYLVFRMHTEPEDAAWATWLTDHGIRVGHRESDMVPLPSGGVFAEAVLGRFNSAEKIDLTRFWNWQESPPPLTAPEIAPISTGSRHAEEQLPLPGFSQPLVNIVNPTSLPDPAGMQAALAALANGNMFRDMSNAATIANLTGQGLAASAAGAQAAASQAGENMKTYVDLMRVAASVATGVPIPGAARSPNQTGGLINLGKAIDKERQQQASPRPAGADSGGGQAGGGGSGTAAGAGGGGGTIGTDDAGYSGSSELDAFRTAGLGIAASPDGTPIAFASWQDRLSAASSSGSANPRLLAEGEAAYAAAARMLGVAQPARFVTDRGPWEFTPGDVLPLVNVLVIAPDDNQGNILYLEGDKLYEYSIRLFLNRFVFSAMERGVSQAEWIVRIGKMEVSIMMGLLVPWYFLLGVSAVGLSLRVYHHREVVQRAIDNGGKLIRALRAVHDRYPTLYQALLKTATREALENLPSGVTAEDVGFLLGRLVRTSALTVQEAGEVAVKPILLAAAKTAAIVAATHLPSITAHAIAAAANGHKEDLKEKLAEAGIQVTDQEAKAILTELYNDMAGQDEVLRDLQEACEAFAPAIEQLVKDVPLQL